MNPLYLYRLAALFVLLSFNGLKADAGDTLALAPRFGDAPRYVLPGTPPPHFEMPSGFTRTGQDDCPTGNIQLTSQEEVDEFDTKYAHCTHISGTINILDDDGDIDNLEGLKNLVEISGALQIGFSNIPGNAKLKNLKGLENLQRLSSLIINNNSALESLEGLSGLQEISWLYIEDNSVLESLDGLSGLQAIVHLYIKNNPELSVCNLPAICTKVKNYTPVPFLPERDQPVFISGNKADCLDLEAVKTACAPPACPSGNISLHSQQDVIDFGVNYSHCTAIDGNLFINGDDINNLDGLGNIVSIRGGLQIGAIGPCNPLLGDLRGLDNLERVGVLQISSNSALTSLAGLENLKLITSGGVEIIYNTLLEDIGALKNMNVSNIYALYVNSNPQLALCNLPNFCTYLSGGGSSVIFGNKDQCISAEAILTACIPPTLAVAGHSDPTKCGGTNGTIDFSTTNLADGQYILYFQKGGEPITANVTISNNSFTLGSLAAGDFGTFSIAFNGHTAAENTPVTLEDPAPTTLSVAALYPPYRCGDDHGDIYFTYSNPSRPTHLSGFVITYKVDGVEQSKGTMEMGSWMVLPQFLKPGVYTDFRFTDHNDCAVHFPGPLVLETGPPRALTAGLVSNPSFCKGTGSIPFTTELPDDDYTLHFEAGGSDISRAVTVSEGKFVLDELTAGSYSNFYINYKGCISIDNSTKILVDPTPVALSVMRVYHPSACGVSDGQINLDYDDNPNIDMTFTISYDRNGQTETQESSIHCANLPLGLLPAGVYTNFRLKDHNQCDVFLGESVTLNAPAAPFITAGEVAHPQSCGGAEGSIDFTTELPEGTYVLAYQKGGQPTTADVTVSNGTFALSGLNAGSYSGFSITHNGCTSSDNNTKVLNDPAPEQLLFILKQNPAACGSADGEIIFADIPSLADNSLLNYKIDGVSASSDVILSAGNPALRGLSGGVYSDFYFTDQKGCLVTYSDPITLVEPAAATLTVGVATRTNQCGGADGKISFTTSLGNGTYSMNFLKNGQAAAPVNVTVANGTFALGSLSAATYSHFSISVNGCVSTDNSSIVVEDPVAPILTMAGSTDPATCGGANGSIHFTTTALPDGSYMFNYSINGISTSSDIVIAGNAFLLSGLTAGTYTAFSLTHNGCIATDNNSKILSDPTAPVVTITPDGPTELCENDLVTLTASEGASYLWSNGQTARSITVGAAGTYKVTVTSAQGCAAETSIVVTQKVCNLPPVALCKPQVTVLAGSSCYAVITTQDLDAGSYDPNGDWTRHTLLNTDGVLMPGNHLITYEVMDPTGAYSTCQSNVQVLDRTAPVARARGLTLELDANGQASITPAHVDDGSTDNCGPVTLSLNRTHFDCVDLGHLQVRLTVTDASGNSSEAIADITIVDNTAPVIQAHNLTLALDENGKAALNRDHLFSGISDNCGIWNIDVSQSEFNCAHLGDNTVTLTVEDVQGNRSTATVLVTVVDTIAPVINTRDITLYLDKDGKAGLSAEQADQGSSDNCGIALLSLDREQFTCDDLGQHALTLTATDATGNRTEASFTLTVADTLAPVVKARDITLYLNAGGTAALTADDVDEGSSDNCGVASRVLQQTAFDCSDTGSRQVQYTVSDASGNATTVLLTVTVSDTTAPEVFAQNVVLELNGEGKAVLSAEETDSGSSDNCGIAERTLSQTNFDCTDLGRRLVTLTVRDVNGNAASDRAVVEVTDPYGVCPCSYGVLAFDRVVMKNNEVSAGGVGVINSGRKVKLRNTVIDREGTFVKAPQSRFDPESESSIYIRGTAPQPEGFRKNTHKDKGTEKVGKGESKTLEAGRYGRIKVGKDATLTFSGGEVFVRKLKIAKNAGVVFTDAAVLLVRKAATLGKAVAFNTGGEQVHLYAGGGIAVGNGAEVRGVLHSQGGLKVRAGGEVTSLEGLFVADKIRGGRNTHWAGGGVLCTGNNEPEPVQTSQKARQAELVEAETSDSTGIRVNLWPNPVVTDRLKISVESDTADGEFTLIDMQGNILARKTYKGHRDKHEIDMSHILPGTYVLRVSSGGKVKALRIMKEK